MKQTRIVIFAKAPQAGFAKTRLIPVLGADGAAELARRMFNHTIKQAIDADIGTVELCMTPADNVAWQDVVIPEGIICSDQGDGDLGARLAAAAERVITAGESIILIGTDCPALEAKHLRQMVEQLEHNDVVMVSTADGGYAALGLKQFHPCLFSGINWSSDTVAMETLHCIGTLGWSVHLLPMLHDIDEAADLRWLPADWPEAVYAP
jgi:rSAM/selenodomain-associated transferase 1